MIQDEGSLSHVFAWAPVRQAANSKNEVGFDRPWRASSIAYLLRPRDGRCFDDFLAFVRRRGYRCSSPFFVGSRESTINQLGRRRSSPGSRFCGQGVENPGCKGGFGGSIHHYFRQARAGIESSPRAYKVGLDRLNERHDLWVGANARRTTK
jgi:hypothetical protein